MSLKENKPDDEANYTMRFVWAAAAVLLAMVVIAIATDKFG